MSHLGGGRVCRLSSSPPLTLRLNPSTFHHLVVDDEDEALGCWGAEAVLAFITRRVTVNLIKGTTEDGEVLDADDYREILLSHSFGGQLILWPLDNWHRAASHSQVTSGRESRSVG